MKNNSRLGLWVIIPGWILAFAARMAQICVGTDMTSGFLKYDNGFFMNACFWGAVILTLAGAAAAAFFDRRNGSAYYQTPVERVTDNKAAVIGFGLLLPAMGALYEGYSEAVIPEGSNISPSPFMMVVNFVFGAIMLITSFVILYKKEFKPGLGFAMTGGAVYYTLRGIGVFLERMAVTTRPEYLINCMTDIVAAVLFMQMAKLLSGNEGKRTRRGSHRHRSGLRVDDPRKRDRHYRGFADGSRRRGFAHRYFKFRCGDAVPAQLRLRGVLHELGSGF